MNNTLKDPVLVVVALLLGLMAIGASYMIVAPPRQVWSAIDPPRAGVDCWLHGGTREVVCIDAIAD